MFVLYVLTVIFVLLYNLAIGMKEEGKKKMVVGLKTSDDKVFELGKAVVCHSEIIDKITMLILQMDVHNYTANIPLSINVCRQSLAMVISYREYNLKEYTCH